MQTFAFKRREAQEAMISAVAEDAQCAMCHWGVAYANGPSLDQPILSPAQAKIVYAAIWKSVAVCSTTGPTHCTTEENGLIQALLERYPESSVTQTRSKALHKSHTEKDYNVHESAASYTAALQQLADAVGDGSYAADVQALLIEAQMIVELLATSLTGSNYTRESGRLLKKCYFLVTRSPANNNPRFWRLSLALPQPNLTLTLMQGFRHTL